ncbi:hypothetical protein EQZ23_03990 [Sphingomonas sp. UV9]|uniref:hypothetical protein n=1 Tax=Sphingomonas sp. UV9 TaxID=1851410 RepID=UPI000FFBCD83|nr:hypothetical protein [Sphingomonas sp. UV9]RXD07238.1 hypothetical protein EQZ23_03990 [Sphingomonas sp. UV9]
MRPHLPVISAKALVGAFFATAALAACSPASEPGAVTADEAHQLNEAAAMLDANSVDLNAVAADPEDAETPSDPDTPSNQSDQTQ